MWIGRTILTQLCLYCNTMKIYRGILIILLIFVADKNFAQWKIVLPKIAGNFLGPTPRLGTGGIIYTGHGMVWAAASRRVECSLDSGKNWLDRTPSNLLFTTTLIID